MHRSEPSPPLSRLMESIFGARPDSAVPPQRQPPADVPELLKPAVQRAAARWAATQQRHDTSMRRCKTIDARLARLPDTLAQHSEAARSMTRGLALMQDARQQLAALRAEADGLQPALLALTRLYGELAAIGPAPTADLERQEAAHRQMRSSHYQQLQRALDAQYADAIRDAAQQRAETAARSFQRDLDSFRRGQAVRPRPAARAADLASIVLPASSPHDMDDFFSDVSAKSSGDEAAPARPAPADDEPPAVVVLEDEDFE